MHTGVDFFLLAAEPVAVTTWTGTLSSPNFPHTYPANSSLTWIKSVSSGNRIQISIDLLQVRGSEFNTTENQNNSNGSNAPTLPLRPRMGHTIIP